MITIALRKVNENCLKKIIVSVVLISPRSSNDPNSGHHENPISSESDHNDDEDDEQTILHINK